MTWIIAHPMVVILSFDVPDLDLHLALALFFRAPFFVVPIGKQLREKSTLTIFTERTRLVFRSRTAHLKESGIPILYFGELVKVLAYGSILNPFRNLAAGEWSSLTTGAAVIPRS